MKTYPSITYPGHKGIGKQLHTYDKLDGSNLRFEWSKKKGWYKYGTRRQLLDKTSPIFGPAVPLFHETLADPLSKIVGAQRWQSVVVYCEYWGPQSLSGQHVEGDNMSLAVIDVAPYKRGFVPPVEFNRFFGEFGPQYLGYLVWDQDFLNQVSAGQLGSFEGVVGKGTEGKKRIVYKTKTRAWKDAILAKYGEEKGRKLIRS